MLTVKEGAIGSCRRKHGTSSEAFVVDNGPSPGSNVLQNLNPDALEPVPISYSTHPPLLLRTLKREVVPKSAQSTAGARSDPGPRLTSFTSSFDSPSDLIPSSALPLQSSFPSPQHVEVTTGLDALHRDGCMGTHPSRRPRHDAAIRGPGAQERDPPAKGQAVTRGGKPGEDGTGHTVGLHVSVRENGGGCGAQVYSLWHNLRDGYVTSIEMPGGRRRDN